MNNFIVREILEMNETYWGNFEKACRGIPPQIASPIPRFLTAEKTLQVYARLLKQEAEKMKKILKPLDDKGRSFWEDEEKVARFIISSKAALGLDAEE